MATGMVKNYTAPASILYDQVFVLCSLCTF